jgi:hypothetical protein
LPAVAAPAVVADAAVRVHRPPQAALLLQQVRLQLAALLQRQLLLQLPLRAPVVADAVAVVDAAVVADAVVEVRWSCTEFRRLGAGAFVPFLK